MLPDKISLLYNQLFAIYDSKEDVASETESVLSTDEDRMGTGEVRAKHVKVEDTNKTITLSLDLVSSSETGEIIPGIHIVDENDNEVFAVNTKMIQAKSISGLSKGETKRIEWSFPNMLATGNYKTTLTFVNDKGVALDWVEEAARFSVQRKIESTTSVLPNIAIKYSE